MKGTINIPLNRKLAVDMVEAEALTGICRSKLEELRRTDPLFPSFREGRKVCISVDMLRKYINDKAMARAGEDKAPIGYQKVLEYRKRNGK